MLASTKHDIKFTLWVFAVVTVLFCFSQCHYEPVWARGGSWAETTPQQREWFQKLMVPWSIGAENTGVDPFSCCGEADAYEADDFDVVNGELFAIITDERGDEFPDGTTRPHIEPGTRIMIPHQIMVKPEQGNPTGHGWVFIGREVYCYVSPGGG